MKTEQNPYKYDAKEFLFQSTLNEIDNMISTGMNKLTVKEANEALLNLGFKIQKSNSFYYSNTANQISYNAYSCYIIDIKTKLSFANVNFGNIAEERERLEQLQKFRRYNFAVENKSGKYIIWEM